MRMKPARVAALLALATLSLLDCNLDDPGCNYGDFRCRGDVLELCGASNNWLEFKNCEALDPPQVCKDRACQAAPSPSDFR